MIYRGTHDSYYTMTLIPNLSSWNMEFLPIVLPALYNFLGIPILFILLPVFSMMDVWLNQPDYIPGASKIKLRKWNQLPLRF